MDALFYSIDGNFHANLKDKPLDLADFPLTKGGGYFANEDAVEAYQATLGPLMPEVSEMRGDDVQTLTWRQPSTCHNFKSLGLGVYCGQISGTVGVFCARHMFVLPGGHVDLQKGERYVE